MSRKEIDPKTKQVLEELRSVPPRDPVRAVRGRAEFLNQAARLRLAKSREKGKHIRWINLPVIPRKKHIPVFKPLIAIMLAIAVFFGGTATTVFASQTSLPHQILYPVKVWSEDAILALDARPQAQIQYNLAFSDRRIVEMTRLLSNGDVIPEEVMNRLQNELDQALQMAAELDDLQMCQQLEKIRQRAEIQLQETDKLIPGAPQADHALLLRAQARIREQVQLARLGSSDPEEYRRQVHQRFQFRGGEGTPGQGNGPGGFSLTPIPDGSGGSHGGDSSTGTPDQNGSGTGGSQPATAPGQYGPGSQSPTSTPQYGSGGNSGSSGTKP